MKRRLFFLLAVPFCCGFGIGAQQPLAGTMKGIVRNQTGTPVARVALTAKNLDSGSPRTTVSDSAGAFQFVDLPPGRYSVTAQKDGYREFTVALVTVASGETVDLPEINLSPTTP
jgi:hypothetical protein